MSTLFDQITLGNLTLSNRAFMAPLTRNRARPDVRLSPRGTFNDMSDEDPESTFTAAVEATSTLDLGYLHVVEASPGDPPASAESRSLFQWMRRLWRGVYVANGGYNRVTGESAIRLGGADAIAYGRAFLANPDLPERLKRGAPLNEPNPATFYGGTEEGYTDYPALTAGWRA